MRLWESRTPPDLIFEPLTEMSAAFLFEWLVASGQWSDSGRRGNKNGCTDDGAAVCVLSDGD